MKSYLIKNANIVNENKVFKGDVLIEGNYIKEISTEISVTSNVEIIRC